MPASMANNPKVVLKKMVKKMVIDALLFSRAIDADNISCAMTANIIIQLLYFLKYLLKGI